MQARKESQAPVGIIAASGALPFAVADALTAKGRDVVVFGIGGVCDPAAIAAYRHHWVALGQIGRLFRQLSAETVRDIVMLGTIVRPAVRDLRLDWTTIKLLPQIAAAFRGGDDHLMVKIGRIFERHGFHVVGLRDIVPELLMPAGPLTRAMPDGEAANDVALGQELLRALSPFDIGQAVVVIDRHVVAVEGIEGTDGLLARVAHMRAQGTLRSKPGRGVLVKAPKAGQDLRFDLPTVGPQTIKGIAGAGLAGIAVAAHSAIALDPQAMIDQADRAGVFILGMTP